MGIARKKKIGFYTINQEYLLPIKLELDRYEDDQKWKKIRQITMGRNMVFLISPLIRSLDLN